MSLMRMLGRSASIRPLNWPISNIVRRLTTHKNVEADDDCILSMTDVRELIGKKLGLPLTYSVIPHKRDNLLQYTPKREDLPPRSLQDSFTSALIPLSRSMEIQNNYVTPLGHVRLGRLMEDMDLFSVWVCIQHVCIPDLDPEIPLPYCFVTVLVDKCDFMEYMPSAEKDVRISGHVTWVGTSSMEVAVWLEQVDQGQLQKVTRAIFLMAARNATNTKAAPVNPLVPANEREKAIHSGGTKRSERRKRLLITSIHTVRPNEDEQKLMFDLFKSTLSEGSVELNARLLPKNAIWMKETMISTTMSCQPEHRNSHNTVFGGFLMRNALEISSICANFYAKKRAKLEAICDIMFQEPVSVAAYLKMTAHVVYTEDKHIQVLTIANILDPLTSARKTTNVFSYTFKTKDKCPSVIPRTYDEMLWYIEGRRKFRYSMGVDGPKRGAKPH